MENNNINSITNAPVLAKKGTFPATVAKVIDDYKLVINRGLEHGIREGQRMLVYPMSDEEIKDPNTGGNRSGSHKTMRVSANKTTWFNKFSAYTLSWR